MNLVIEIIGDDGDLMPDDKAERLVRSLLAGVTEETYGCLELTDLDGRALLAKVVGTVDHHIYTMDAPGKVAGFIVQTEGYS